METKVQVQATKIDMKDETTAECQLIKQKQHEKLYRWTLIMWFLNLISYVLFFSFVSLNSIDLYNWPRKFHTTTHLENIQSECFQMKLFMHAYLVVILMNHFVFELSSVSLSVSVRRRQKFSQSNGTVYFFIGCYIVSIICPYVAEYNETITKKGIFQDEYVPDKAPISFFYFQVVAIVCVFLQSVVNIIMNSINAVQVRHYKLVQLINLARQQREQNKQCEKKNVSIHPIESSSNGAISHLP
ncbi:unnamed protein product [Rotaria socialis]|uniref:Uncharacterized protein n=2 Tax=Rotaria socialis TaxID=392032 RepID=A0A817SU48_9BILA|nr:unnamed protein product [Rotaria socialis]